VVKNLPRVPRVRKAARRIGSFREGWSHRPTKRDSRFGGTYLSVLPKTLSGIYLLKISLFEVFLGVFTLWFDLFEIYLSGMSLWASFLS
jgi:hypothetical protein